MLQKTIPSVVTGHDDQGTQRPETSNADPGARTYGYLQQLPAPHTRAGMRTVRMHSEAESKSRECEMSDGQMDGSLTREEAHEMIEAALRRHNRNATLVSMALGFTFMALFVDGLLRVLGVIPPFMGQDISIIDDLEDIIRLTMSSP